MPLPIKSRYTIAEAAKFMKSATGEAITQSQILDWGTQGLYKLHLAIEHCSIRPIGETEIIRVRDSIIELRLTGGQAAILGRGERVGIAECWHNGAACEFLRQRTGDYSGWTPDTVYFGAAALVVIGAELDAFTASISEPQRTAPATDTAPPAPVGTDGDAPAKPAAPAWSLKTSIKKWPGYRSPLYKFLQNALVTGEACPKAQDVLNAWKLVPPLRLGVVTPKRHDELEYELNHGHKKTADLKAIQAAIDGLVIQID